MDSHELATGADGRSVAFVGVGRMGGRMARRLLGAGTTVAVYDRDRAALDALAQEGARVATSPADAAADAALILFSLPGPAQVVKPQAVPTACSTRRARARCSSTCRR